MVSELVICIRNPSILNRIKYFSFVKDDALCCDYTSVSLWEANIEGLKTRDGWFGDYDVPLRYITGNGRAKPVSIQDIDVEVLLKRKINVDT